MRIAALCLEVLLVGAVIAGAAVIYWPAALIVGGTLGIAIIERQTT